MSILASPFLTLSVVDTALKAAGTPEERLRLLSARVHLLQSPHADQKSKSTPAPTPAASSDAQISQPPAAAEGTAESQDPDTAPSTSTAARPSYPPADRTPLLAARLDLADAYLALSVPDLHSASGEAMAVENECKRLNKVSKKWESPPAWVEQVRPLRIRALLVLAQVEDGLGRPARAERNRKLADEL